MFYPNYDDIQKTIDKLSKQCYSYYECYQYDVEGNVHEDLICPINLGLILKLYSVPCCGKLFCLKCIRQWLQRSHSCPNCRKPLQEDQIREERSLFLKRLIYEQVINCNYICNCQEKCKWQGEFENFVTHLRNHLQCEFSCNRIQKKIQEQEKEIEELKLKKMI